MKSARRISPSVTTFQPGVFLEGYRLVDRLVLDAPERGHGQFAAGQRRACLLQVRGPQQGPGRIGPDHRRFIGASDRHQCSFPSP